MYTYKLFFKLAEKLKTEEIWQAFEKVEMPITKVIMDMENRGIRVDIGYLQGVKDSIEQDLIQLKAGIWKEAGKEFDINSPKQLSEILFKERGYNLPEDYKTAKGANSTNEAALEYLGERHKEDALLQKILEYRGLYKLLSAFVISLLEKQRSGVIYTQFRQNGTVTGRLSSNSPNLQQLPRRNDKYDIRKAFIAREGYTFVS